MGAQLTKNDKRTCYVAELSAKDIGRHVCLMGWVQRQRDLGSLIFVDLRDRSGIIQLAFDENTDKAIFDAAFALRSEYSILRQGHRQGTRRGRRQQESRDRRDRSRG